MSKDNNEQTFYEILRVSPIATLKEIKIAYRQRAMEYHPDANPTANNELCHEMMCKINEAYMVLRDVESRQQYDRMLQEKNLFPSANNAEPDVQANKDNQTKSGNAYRSFYPNDCERYEYYNSFDFDDYTQEEFIDWIGTFIERYIILASDYYKQLNIDGSSMIERLYKEFNITLENEKRLSKKKGKTNSL